MKLKQKDGKLISAIMNKEGHTFKENSAMALLWEQQKKVSSYKKASSMRWHPVIIRWCLSIYLKSPGNYNEYECLFQHKLSPTDNDKFMI